MTGVILLGPRAPGERMWQSPAMARRRSDPQTDAERLLASTAPPQLEELFRLIHAVNPTNAGLSRAATAARYRLKSALQSRLLVCYADVVTVRVDPEDDDLVSVVHRLLDRDAAHARVSTLDDEARLVVRRMLTAVEIGDDDPSTPSPVAMRADDDPVSLGHLALQAYDYDRAESCFREALAHRPEPLAAASLIDLLSALGRDEEALGLELAPRLAAAPDVRVRLAEAATAVGDTERALRSSDGLRGPRVGALLRRAVDAAIRSDDGEAARRAFERAREADPSHGELIALQQRLDRLRDGKIAPLEDAVREALDDPDEAELRLATLARALGPHARVERLRAEIDRVRNERVAVTALADADRALSGGDPAAAVRALHEAARRGVDTAARIATIEAGLADEHRARAVARVLTLLARVDPADGERAWLALPPADRARIEAPGLDELGRIAAHVGNEADPIALRSALHAARLREDLLPEDLPAELRGYPPADALRRAVEARLRRRDEEGREALLDRLERALSAGDTSLVREVLPHLPADPRGLRRQLAPLDARAHIEAEWVRMSAEPLPFDARLLAADRAALPDAELCWSERAEQMEHRIADQFRVRELPAAGFEHLPSGLWVFLPGHQTWVDEEGTLVLVEVLVHEVYIVERDVTTLAVRRVIALTTPEPMGKVTWGLFGTRVWIRGNAARWMLVVERRPVRVVRWFDPTGLIGGPVGALSVVDGVGWFHLGETTKGIPKVQRTALVDLDRGARIRSDPPTRLSVALPGGRIGAYRTRGATSTVVLYNARGTEVSELGQAPGALGSPVQDPSGGGVVVPEHAFWLFPGSTSDDVGLVELRAWLFRPGMAGVRLTPTAPLCGRLWWMVSATDDGLLFVLSESDDRDALLSAHRIDGDRLERVWETECPFGVLTASSDGRRAWFICWNRDMSGLDIQRLGPLPVSYDHRLEFERMRAQGPSAASCRGGVEEAPTDPDPDDPDAVARWLAVHGQTLPHQARLERTVAALKRWPSNPSISAVGAHLSLLLNAPQQALDILAAADLDALSLPARRHAVHVMATAHLQLGNLDRAEALLVDGERYPGGCDLGLDRAVLRVVRNPGAAVSDRLRLTAKVVAACAHADRFLEAGDPAAAMDALDDERLWHAREIQSTARRAEAALRWTDGPIGPRERAVGVYRQLAALRHASGYENVPVKGAWTLERFVDLSDRAMAWSTPPEPGPLPLATIPAPPMRMDDAPWAAVIARGRGAEAAGDVAGARRALDDLIRSGGTPAEVATLRGVVARLGR